MNESRSKTASNEFLFWARAALPWAVIHFGVFFVAAYLTNNNLAVVSAATWIVVVLSGAIHYSMGKREGRQESSSAVDASELR